MEAMLMRDVKRIKATQAREELARTGAMFSGAPRLPTSSVIQAAAASAIRPVHGLVRGATKSDSVAAAAATGGRLSDWELYKLAQVFKAMDTDKSGNLSREELAAGLANAEDLGFRVRDKSALDRVFDALDTDHSNSISWKEFVRGTSGETVIEHHEDGPVPPLVFVPLSPEESSDRAMRYHKEAASLQARLLQMDKKDPEYDGIRRRIHSLSEKATFLEDLAATAKGKYDGKKRAMPVAPPRSDIVSFISSVPAKRAVRAAKEGVLAKPSGSPDSDSDTDDEDGRLLGEDIDAFRLRRAARKKHMVVTTHMALPGGASATAGR